MITLDKNYPMSDVVFKLEFIHKDPVELTTYTDSMSSLASRYQHFIIKSSNGQPIEKQAKLYISKIESGSIITHLVDLFPVAIPFIENSNAIVEFTKHLKGTFDYFLGRSDKKPDLDKTGLQEINKIIQPVAKDRSSQYNISTMNVTGDVYLNVSVNTTEANAIQNVIRDEIKLLEAPQPMTPFERVVFYWYQAKKDFDSKTGFSGVIESISQKPLKVFFAEDNLAMEMLGQDDKNPFVMAYVVDVSVENVKGQPFAYKILKVHEVFHL